MPSFLYLYPHRNGTAASRFTRVRHSLPGDGSYPYNLKKMSKNSYIHTGVECHSTPDQGTGVW